jgi:hypothetical protein
VDRSNAFAAEHLVEAAAELGVAVVDQEPCPLEQAGEAEVARLLSDPGSSRVGGAAGEVDTAAFELDEEEHVVAAQRDRLDGEEITGQDGRALLAEEVAPTRASAARCWLEPCGQE